MKKIKYKKLGAVNVMGRVVPIFESKVMPSGYEDCLGLYYEGHCFILLNANMPKHQKTVILYHELFHALMDRMGFNQTDIGDNLHEMLCEAFRNFIADNFSLNNKKLINKL
jgi:Zn-dependent peptidase ImmA (M78 family)